MTVNITPVDINTDTWRTLVTRVNSLISTVGSQVVTAGGDPTVGNVTVYGRITANTYVLTSGENLIGTNRAILTGTGLTGGGDLSANRTIALDANTSAAIAKANTSVQPSDLGSAAYQQANTFAPASAANIKYDAAGPIYNTSGIGLGGYILEFSAYRNSNQTSFAAEILTSGPGGSVTCYLDVNNSMVYGPVTVTLGNPINANTSFAVATGQRVTLQIIAMSGNVTEFIATSYGKVT